MEEAVEWGWTNEGPTRLEAEHWHQWNGHSPEKEFCDFVSSVILLKYATSDLGNRDWTRVYNSTLPKLANPHARYVCFETSVELVERMRKHWIFRTGRAELYTGNLDPDLAAEADLTILDSAGGPVRIEEIKTWWKVAKSGAMVLIHDASWRHSPATTHYQHAGLIDALGIPGVFMVNPRGSFFGQKQW